MTSTAESSRLAATTIARARGTPATRSTSERVPEPCTVTRPSADAASSIAWSVSTTTICSGSTPSDSTDRTADRPFVPYPTTTT